MAEVSSSANSHDPTGISNRFPELNVFCVFMEITKTVFLPVALWVDELLHRVAKLGVGGTGEYPRVWEAHVVCHTATQDA